MAKTTTSHANIIELAKIGAAHRYQELLAELESLARHFPHLRTLGARSRRRTAPASNNSAASKETSTPVRPRSKMSAAARKAVSARMKKYWAARRKDKKS